MSYRRRRTSQFRRHPQQQFVALANDVDAGARGLAAKVALLPIHVDARGAAGERADARADDLLAAIVAAADDVAEEVARAGAQTAPRAVRLTRCWPV